MSLVTKNLERIITEKGLRKEYVARKSGLSSQMISDLLAERKVFRADFVPPLCATLGVEPNELFKELPPETN